MRNRSWPRGQAGALPILRITLGCAVLAASAGVLAAPTITKLSGPMDHNGTVTISGAGFGSKPKAAPWVWDNATSVRITDNWGGAWPDGLPGFNTQYYPVVRGVNPPHSHDTRLIAGAHADNTGANTGYAVIMFKTLTVPSFPATFYASWYQVADTAWHFGGDNNWKIFDYSLGENPYADNQSWYTCYGPPHPDSNFDTGAQWTIETGTPLHNPDLNGHNAWWGAAVNPMAGKWAKIEMAFKASSQNDGYVTIWENGKLVMNYRGPTDTYPGNTRTLGVGGYARMQGYPNNWRYYDDVYVDTTLARVVLADKPVLSQASIVEVQIPSAWSDGSITTTVNLGKFSQGQSAYLFVVDSSGSVSATGFSVTAGGTAAAPSAPSAFQVH